jgi:hypothetical protein
MSIPFVISYAGNKHKEFKHINPFVNVKDKTFIIEPFCGSSSMSFNFWKENKDKNITYILNDYDKVVHNIYKAIKKYSPEEFQTEVNKFQPLRLNKEIWNENVKEAMSGQNLFMYIFYLAFSSFRPFLYNTVTERKKGEYKLSNLQREFFEFIKLDNVILKNSDWLDVFDEYKDNADAIFLMDPPYMDSCNDFYQLNKDLRNTNIYEFFFNNSSIKYKADIYFILEYNWIIRLLFKGKTAFEYEKTYNITKKKTIHAIIKF